MNIDGNHLKLSERMTLRQLMRAKAGEVTVREAREHLAPTGWAFVVQVVGMTVLALSASAFFLPFLVVAIAIPVVMLLRQRATLQRWARLLPAERDAEIVTLG